MGDENSQRFNAITTEHGATREPVLSYSLPRSLGNISTVVCSCSQAERCGFPGHDDSESRRREQQQSESCNLLSSGTSSNGIDQSLVGAFSRSSLQPSCAPHQENSDVCSKDPGYNGTEEITLSKDLMVSRFISRQQEDSPRQPVLPPQGFDICGTLVSLSGGCADMIARLLGGEMTKTSAHNVIFFDTDPCHLECGLYDFCLFKRRIIERDDIEFALYIISIAEFQEVFPKIKKDEALVYHGTEFPLIGPASQNFISVHKQFQITGSVRVTFELVQGEKFAIVSAPTTTASISEIRSKSENRIACGFAVEVITICFGGTDEVFEDIIKVVLQSGDRTVHFFFPVAYYEASVCPWLYNSLSVTCMPEEDKEALRSCHVDLLQNIGDVISLCHLLYQHKILDSDDLEDITNCKKKRERNAAFLDILKRRGNVLDYVIKVMQGQRKNQGAAVILQRRRHSGANPQ